MALHFFLALPSSSPHSHISLPFLKLSSSSSPPKPTLLLPSQNPNSQIGRRRRREVSILFRRRFSSLATTQSTTEGGGENGEASESVEKLDRRRLIAQNIPWTCTAEDVRSLFERHGTVLDVELSMYNTSKNRGLAFITMSSEEEAYAALSSLQSYDMDGRVIKVEFSTSLKKKPSEPKVTAQKYNVYVGNLAWNVKSQDIRELFSASGSVLSAQVIFQTKPRRPAGYGFVSFASIEEAEAAISTLNGKKFMGRPLRLGLSKLQNVEGSSNEDGKSGDSSTELKIDEELAEQANET
ncbi:28 kDa ribonucleoprotein, chloroplastic-like [Iris pallida]|uniref:28 kDa ribonucleoprotein, chloroplastic-like n=1 Tax=Iris pallida TaxID=29817 RepID=A0AAX6F6Y2_IRIPA|nr:28 kDa ribonucleoprotein, chloroplastic-like [Iris pallida]